MGQGIKKGDRFRAVADNGDTFEGVAVLVAEDGIYSAHHWHYEAYFKFERLAPALPTEEGSVILIKGYKGSEVEPPVSAVKIGGTYWRTGLRLPDEATLAFDHEITDFEVLWLGE